MRRRPQKRPPNQVTGGDSFFKPRVQTKLAMGTPGDKYEVEADRMADQVVNKTSGDGTVQKMEGEEEVQQKPLADSITAIQRMEMAEEEPVQAMEEEESVQAMVEEEAVQAMEEEESVKAMEEEEPVQAMEEEESVQAKCAECENEDVQKMEEEESVQTKKGNKGTTGPSIEGQLRNGSGGSKMNTNIQSEMESGFGTGFSNVNIHTDSQAQQMSEGIGAQAFTHGNDVYFNQGKYNPNSKEGKHLLAHELTHTIQQGSANGNVENEVKKKAIQRSAKWKKGSVHKILNPAVYIFTGGSPITWPLLNGTKLSSNAAATGAIKEPTLKTSSTSGTWTAQVDTIPINIGSYDETVLKKGPWANTITKAQAGQATGLPQCAGAGNSDFRVKGKPSDKKVYKANRRHENHHVADHKKAFKTTVEKWDKALKKAKKKKTKYTGASKAAAIANLWTAMGGTPSEIAIAYFDLAKQKGGAYHGTAKGGPMSLSNPDASADCSTSKLDITNPS